MHIKLLKFSRHLHKWLGIYLAVITVIWLFELVMLPVLYSVEQSPQSLGTTNSSVINSSPFSMQRLLAEIEAGYYGSSENIELRYQPHANQFVIVDTKRFSHHTLDAKTGEVLSRKLDHDALFMKKSGLGWLDETLSTFLKAPFEISFVILSITGLYLIAFPYFKQKKRATKGILSMRPGQQFLFKATTSPEDMAKTASIGLLPGVRATILYLPSHGPVMLSARNTRIAVARSVAASFIIEPVEV